MTIYSTHSSTQNQFRFRVFIPTNNDLTIEAYEAITHQILSDLIEAGYANKKGNVDKTHGLDTSKMSPISLFYLPCRPADKEGPSSKRTRTKLDSH